MTIPADIEKKARRVYDALGRGSVSAAVRVNWLRGGIALDSIISETKERCAQIADVRRAAWLEAAQARREAAFPLPTNFQTERAGEAEFIASAIRNEGAGE